MLAYRRGDKDEARGIFKSVLDRVPNIEKLGHSAVRPREVAEHIRLRLGGCAISEPPRQCVATSEMVADRIEVDQVHSGQRLPVDRFKAAQLITKPQLRCGPCL